MTIKLPKNFTLFFRRCPDRLHTPTASETSVAFEKVRNRVVGNN